MLDPAVVLLELLFKLQGQLHQRRIIGCKDGLDSFLGEFADDREVLGRLEAFADLDRPLLVGPSRKSFLARPLPATVAPAATAARVDQSPPAKR